MKPRFNLSLQQATAIDELCGTPVYVYSEKILNEQIDRLGELRSPDWQLYLRYAMKACPTAAILRLMKSRGLGIDAGSIYEVRRALHAGFEPHQIQLTSQELPPLRELLELVGQGMLFTACSLHQLQAYGEAGGSKSVGVRINPGIRAGEFSRTSVGGHASSFGIWHEKIDDILALQEKYQFPITQLHQHVGVGVELTVWPRSVQKMFEVARSFPSIERINLGGGFKVSRTGEESEIALDAIHDVVAEHYQSFSEATGRNVVIEFEPGTFLLAHAGAVLSKVTDIVDTGTDGNSFVKIDTGMNDIIRPMMYGAKHPIECIRETASDSKDTKSYIVVGHCCESGDVFTVEKGDPETLEPRTFPELKRGDYILIGGAGAYCSSMSAMHYNSYPRSPEVLLPIEGEARIIRRRENPEDVWKDEVS